MSSCPHLLRPGVRVRFVGQGYPFRNPVCLLLVGRTGVIRQATALGWDVEMDTGCYDLDAHPSTLVPISDDEAETDAACEEQLEAA